MLRLAIASLALVAVTPPASADCALLGLEPKVISRLGTEISPDGGILVMAAAKMGGKLQPGDPAIAKSWRFKDRSAEPTFVSLAPGLAVIRPPRDAAGRAIGGELLDDRRRSLFRWKLATKPLGPPPAPVIKSLTHQSWVTRRISSRVTAVFDTLPAGVIAVVLADAKGTPRSFGTINVPTIHGGPPLPANTAYPFQHHECEVLPNGTVASKPGDVVTLRFVDETGRISPPSKPVKIVPAKP